MKTIGLRDQYDRDGFLLIPSVLSRSDVDEIRAFCDGQFRDGSDYINTSRMMTLPLLYRTMFREPITRVLKDVLGDDFTLYPNFNVQKNSFGDYRLLHRDCDSEGKEAYLLRPDYRFVKCGIYLQDNDPEWGGGINVTAGRHRLRSITGSPRWDFRLYRVRDVILMKAKERRVDIKAGDLVIFDSRLPHTSTFASHFKWEDVQDGRLRVLPPDRTKYVIYWDASSTASYVADFMQNSARRAKKEVAFANYVRLRYPESFPPDFVEAVEKAGIKVAQLERKEALHWENVYRQSLIIA